MRRPLPRRTRRGSRSRAPAPRRLQRGMAMLVAILLVALATIIAASIGYESAQAVRRTSTAYAFDQSILIAQGAEALAAYGLREVWRATATSGRTINMSQPWAQPVGPIPVVPGVQLDGHLEDLQGRFNINSLVVPDSRGNMVVDPVARRAFEELLALVGLETTWSGYVIDWIDPDIQPQTPEGAEDSVYLGMVPPYLTPNKYITSITELLALPNFGEARYQKLSPYITALPPEVKINVCTASPQVLDAFLQGQVEFSRDPEDFAKSRAAAGGCYPAMADYATIYNRANPTAATQNTAPAAGNVVAAPGAATPPATATATAPGTLPTTGLAGHFQVTSSFFRLTSHITTDGGAEFYVYSLIFQDQSQGTARPILRSYTPD
jgi:general secretion pathway protein K